MSNLSGNPMDWDWMICTYCGRLKDGTGWRTPTQREIVLMNDAKLVDHVVCPPCGLVQTALAKTAGEEFRESQALPLCVGCRTRKPKGNLSSISNVGPTDQYTVCDDCYASGGRLGELKTMVWDGQPVTEPRLLDQDGNPWRQWFRCLSCERKFYRYNMTDTICSRRCVEGSGDE